MAIERERIRLENQKGELLEQLRTLGNLMRGSLYTAHVRCGAPNCACANGEKHKKIHISVNLKGRTRGAYIGKSRADAVQGLIDEYQRAWRIIEKLTEINLDLLRPTRTRK